MWRCTYAAPRGKKCTVGDEALDGVTLMDTLLNRISQLESAMEVHAKNNVTDEDIDDVPDETQEDLQVGTNQKKTVTTNSLSNDDGIQRQITRRLRELGLDSDTDDDGNDDNNNPISNAIMLTRRSCMTYCMCIIQTLIL